MPQAYALSAVHAFAPDIGVSSLFAAINPSVQRPSVLFCLLPGVAQQEEVSAVNQRRRRHVAMVVAALPLRREARTKSTRRKEGHEKNKAACSAVW